VLENTITTIINSNLSREQKEALLKELANESIKKQQAENSFETKREQLIEKNRQKAQETRERLEQYQKEAYKKEIIANSDKEVQKYIEELSKIKNNRGENIYKDLEQEYKDGKITKEEIYDLYEKVFYKKSEIYENVFKGINQDTKETSKDVENKSKGNEFQKDEIHEDENEIVDVRDGTELTKKEKFKRLAKKTLKIGAVLGAIGLIGGVIYHFVNTGDSSQIEESLKTIADTVNNSAVDIPDYTNITDVGDVKEVFTSNDNAMQNINALTPNDNYFQSEIQGYTTTNNQMIEATNMEEVIRAYNNGENISSLYVGNEEGIDGFVNKVYDEPLREFLESKGGRAKW